MTENKLNWINFENNHPVTVTLRYDIASAKAKEKEGNWGKYLSYNIACEGGLAFSASEALYKKLLPFKAGEKIIITKANDGEKTNWEARRDSENPIVDVLMAQKLNDMDSKLDQILRALTSGKAENKVSAPVGDDEDEIVDDVGF